MQLTRLKRGSLPRIVTAYGRIETGRAARRTVTAPVAAVVDAISVRPGEEVAANAPLVRLVPSPRTRAAYARALSAVRVARELVRRTRALLRQRLATGQQLADAEKSRSDAEASLTALQAEGAGGPQILRAPFRAIVTAVSTSRGALAAQGAALVDLARPTGLVLRVGVVPDHAAAIRPGQPAQITRLGRRDAVAGNVLLRAAMVDPRTGLVPVDISLPAGRFLPGEPAEARIVTGRAQGFVVPHAAILVDDRGASYVVQAENRIARRVPVRVLVTAGDRDVVAGRLNPAAPLILAGNHQLEDGMRVRVANPQRTGAR